MSTDKIKRKEELKKNLFVFSIIIVQLIVFAIFYVYCNFKSILMAFQQRVFGGKTIWTFDNFIQIFQDVKKGMDGQLWLATKNTFKFFLLSQILFPISFINSYFLYKKVPGHKIFRIVFFVPSILSAVVWSTLYKNIVGTDGPIAAIWQMIGGLESRPTFLTDTRYALGFVMLYSIWFGVVGNFVLFSGTLTRIPDELIEVGDLDGITWHTELIKVIVPMVWPTISTVWLLSLMGLFTASGEILLLTGGSYDTMTLSYYLFTRVYSVPETSNLYNYSSAIGLVLTLLTLPIVFIVQFFLNKVEDVQY